MEVGQQRVLLQGSTRASPATGPAEPVARPCPVSCVQMNFHMETESGETSEVFTRRKRVRGHTGGLRQSCPRGGLKHFYGAFLLDFLWLITLLFLALSLYLVYIQVHLLAKLDSSKEAYG